VSDCCLSLEVAITQGSRCKFRCCFVSDEGKVLDFEMLDVRNEAEATRRAQGMLYARGIAAAVELWDTSHLVSRVSRSPDKDRT
jgi:hypothetical protein